jgi:hypothetical protein
VLFLYLSLGRDAELDGSRFKCRHDSGPVVAVLSSQSLAGEPISGTGDDPGRIAPFGQGPRIGGQASVVRRQQNVGLPGRGDHQLEQAFVFQVSCQQNASILVLDFQDDAARVIGAVLGAGFRQQDSDGNLRIEVQMVARRDLADLCSMLLR